MCAWEAASVSVKSSVVLAVVDAKWQATMVAGAGLEIFVLGHSFGS